MRLVDMTPGVYRDENGTMWLYERNTKVVQVGSGRSGRTKPLGRQIYRRDFDHEGVTYKRGDVENQIRIFEARYTSRFADTVAEAMEKLDAEAAERKAAVDRLKETLLRLDSLTPGYTWERQFSAGYTLRIPATKVEEFLQVMERHINGMNANG